MKTLQQTISDAESIRSLTEDKAWKMVEALFKEKLAELDSINDVTSIKQLEGKKFAKRVLTDWWVSVQGVIDAGNFAKKELEIEKNATSIYRTTRV